MTEWQIRHTRGAARDVHLLEPPSGRVAMFHEVELPTLVLGSTQSPNDVNGRVADRLGVEVVVRRSGGSAVLLMPGEHVWLDVVIGPGDPLWLADVGEAMMWIGALWHRVLGSFGVPATVHRGPLVRTAWSSSVCFAGVGPGEVCSPAGAKIVGISQRRTRSYSRFQTMCHLRWRPELVAALVGGRRPLGAQLAGLVDAVDIERSALVAALGRRLERVA